MDLAAVERALAASEARAILVDPRLVRRVIKRHRRVPGMGLRVPHDRCFTLAREALLAIVSPGELGHAAATLPDQVILLPRPERDDVAARSLPDLLDHVWRYAFHARVHQELERLTAAGVLTPARIRERIHRIGQTEFDEIRLVLRQDELLLPPHDDLETYAEFAALYLELSTFAPALVAEMFPTLGESGAAGAALAEDLDVARLLEDARPEGATPRAAPSPGEAVPGEPAEEEDEADAAPGPASRLEADAFRALADAARAKGNVARSALLRVRAGAEGEARADLEAMAERLQHAVHPADPAVGGAEVLAWTEALLGLAKHAEARGGIFRRVEARLLYDVQSACLAAERAVGKIDLAGWVLSLGRRPVARLLPATRAIRVARRLESAALKVSRVGLPEAERARLGELLVAARHRADDSLREELEPVVRGALGAVGFHPGSTPERVALAKMVEELLDQATAHGHLSLGLLRDAVSRNQLKMADVAGVGELVGADALLAADRRLADAIDGVHRRGEIYLRALQKVSSLLFGTGTGRFLVMYLLLPAGGAYVALFGSGLMITEIGHLSGLMSHHHHLHFAEPLPWALTAVLLFGLLHSAAVRSLALQVTRAVGLTLGAIFVHAPRWILSRPLVQRVLGSAAVLALRRFVLKPGAVTAALVYVTPLYRSAPGVALPAAGAIFVAVSALMNTRVGLLVEEVVLDVLARTLRRVQRHLLPGLFRFIAGFFRRLTDAIDRGLYAVDEWLRFRQGQQSWALGVKAVLGLVWFAFAYVLRIYVNLLLEPTFNPLKHFPTVTVAAKMMLPVDQPMAATLTAALTPVVGAFLGGSLAALTVVSTPGLFGFLVWELKENYKLYAATRPTTLRPVVIGHHGETMSALMKPGFHSGTLPKLWAKLRRAARKGDPAVEKHKEAMREIEEAIERFVDRELSALLRESERWEGDVHVTRVALASNRVRFELARRSHSGHTGAAAETCAIAFEEQSGWLCACVARAGWISTLGAEERVLFENALAGLYQRAGVDFVREQIAAALPPEAAFDIADEGLVVWPPGWATELIYDLTATPTLTAVARGDAAGSPGAAPPAIERAAIVFREQGIAWSDWVVAWSGEPRRVVKGASLLPAPLT